MNGLSVSDISLSHGALPILNAIQFELSVGSIAAIVGPNGAGKSTLIKILSGEWKADRGEISIGDVQSNKMDIQTRARCVAVLPQHSSLNFPFSVEEVVRLGRSPHRTGTTVDDDIVSQSLIQFDLEQLRSRLYPELSGGEKQRVQLARVLTQIWRAQDGHPRILLLDEPLTALDLRHQQQLLKGLRQFAKTDVTILMTLHDLNIVKRYTDQVLVLEGGLLVAKGPSNEILTKELVESVFHVAVDSANHNSHQLLFFM